jgi:Transposase DDE domain group 1
MFRQFQLIYIIGDERDVVGLRGAIWKENALRWTRLSCHAFRHNAVRLQLHALAHNLANFLRTLALPEEVEQWSLTTLREKLVKIGARVVRHGRCVVFQLAEVAVPRALFAEILRRIDRLQAPARAGNVTVRAT